MKTSQISIIIKNGEKEKIERFFVDFYNKDRSPCLPYFILSDVITSGNRKDNFTITFINWRIAQIAVNKNKASKEIAKIIFSDYPAGFALLLEFVEGNREVVTSIVRNIEEKLIEVGFQLSSPQSKTTRGPTVNTQQRADAFKEIKDENPNWSRAKVAMEYNDKFNQSVTEDTVKNVYRAMNWKWERSDRIR